MHDYLDGKYPITCNWACHRARGSAGGTDYGMMVGTPILASFSGTLFSFYETATNLNKASLTSDANPALVFWHLHLSAFVPNGHYNEGDIIGYSGGRYQAHGSGTSTGPHLHVHAYYNGVIHDVHDYFTVPAGLPGTPITPTPTPPPKRREKKMGAFYRIATGQGAGSIFWQPTPGAKLIALDGTTWTAYAAQGNVYADYDAQVIQQLMRDTGTVA